MLFIIIIIIIKIKQHAFIKKNDYNYSYMHSNEPHIIIYKKDV